jgi:hypothetical protein
MNAKHLLDLPKMGNIRRIWTDQWYDGMLSGVVEYQGQRYYAVCVDENDLNDLAGSWWRRYLVVDLPADVWETEQQRHDFFVEKVGSHFEFEADGSRLKSRDNMKPSATWHEFYERYPPCESRDYKQYPHVGWFESA